MGKRNADTLEFLRTKAASLPRCPGVYIMENEEGEVIYVGKSRSLRDRVSQYFHGSHDIKTSKMAFAVFNFRFVICASEMDALVLENDLIKKYSPKYNILLKDSKSYPYIKITDGEYPRIVLSRKRTEKGRYFGPYSGAGVVYGVIGTIERTLGLPSCKHSFPKDIGRVRPCVYRQIGRCCGVCAGDVTREEYSAIIDCAAKLLKGNTKSVADELERRMLEAAEAERFEEAARCRDSIAALSELREKRKTLKIPTGSEYDVIALSSSKGHQCAAVFYVRDGIISDSEQFIFGADEITGFITKNETDGEEIGAKESFDALSGQKNSDGRTELSNESERGTADGDFPLSAFIINLYSGREYIPDEILLSFEMPERERELVGEFLSGRSGHKVTLKTPKRGELRSLCEMAENDAETHFESRRRRTDSDERVLVSLASALKLEVVPDRIECYDISNYGDELITAGMIVVKNGRFKKSDYRYFRIKSGDGQDDYGSMRETLERRFSELSGDDPSFSELPDLILLDGGENHVSVVREVARRMGADVPIFGMVKDKKHRTRTVTDGENEIDIASDIALFRFVYGMQEEVHRFTVSRMQAAKLKTLKTSGLEKIKGIGRVKSKELLLSMGTLENIKNADAETLMKVKGICERDALEIVSYFEKIKEKE